MRLVRFATTDGARYGILTGEHVTPTEARTLEDAMALTGSDAPPVPLASLDLLAPVERPRKILGIGVNYAAHAAESVSFVDTKAPQVQKWFNKQATAANAPFGKVHLPRVSDQLDYEVELVVVIGKHGRHVPRERAMDIIAGFCVGCDYSVRDWQKASQTMIMGKGFDTHAPFGPALVSPDEVADLSALQLRSFVNGELRQTGHVRDMIHDIPAQIAHLTAAFTLEPGDLIFTGTPAGVGAAHTPPKWLKAGDRVRLEIDEIGMIENEIVPEPEGMRIG
ncbi:fumarylacetoacetate hydrolase family protein [Hyphomonas sp.]|uniref:fumarylacetoacetate hydrolase family protein n=1 Tax=Hyphomonas sp. TaxID=87 RepID=UPI0025C26051|nr:fumarylacetoacetate hydrolase family protein [Hyphomonas sp.]